MMLTKATLASALLALAPLSYALPQAASSSDSSSYPYPGDASTSPPPAAPAPETVGTSSTYNGTATATVIPSATTTGALMTEVLAASIPALPVNPVETMYPSDGQLHAPEPAPYTPAGGLGTNGTTPVYNVQSDFDYQSLALALYQEYIELDLFHHGLAMFSVEDFTAANLTAEDRFLIEFMADQEVGHATLLSNILGLQYAPRQCSYQYPFTTVREFIDFCQKLTRFGESGVYGFLNHLNSREAGQLLLQSITTEARQQMIFRQFEGLFPMPVWFEVGVPQSWAWTLLAPYIASCPANQTRLAWQNFPALTVLNNPNPFRMNQSALASDGNVTGSNNSPMPPPAALCNGTCSPAITHNRSVPLSFPGREVWLSWEDPGKMVGPNNSYVTSTTAGDPQFVMWVNQLNATYTPLMNISGNTGMTIQPNTSTFIGDPSVNGTMFIALTDLNLTVTPFNISMVNPHVRAGPALYQAG